MSSFNNDKVKWFPLTKEYKDEFMIKYRFPKTKLHAPPIQLLKLDLCKTFVNIKFAVYMCIMYINSTILHIHFAQRCSDVLIDLFV